MMHRMKCWLVGLVVVALVVVAFEWVMQPTVAEATREQTIPEQAIRLRVVANSDSAGDQRVKMAIRDALFMEMATWSERPVTLEQSRTLFTRKLSDMKRLVAQQLLALDADEQFTIQLGLADFPQKTYGGRVYPAGQYEALVVTLGEGAGHNWWCVVFPQLCFEQTEPTEPAEELRPNENYPENQEPQIRFWIWEQFKKWFA